VSRRRSQVGAASVGLSSRIAVSSGRSRSPRR
jgi:hypothetical protein